MNSNRGKRVCQHCGLDIVYDSTVRLWYTVKKKHYYCPKDSNTDKCEHRPALPEVKP